MKPLNSTFKLILLVFLFYQLNSLFAQDQTYNFNGSTQYASVPYNAALNPSGNFTIEAWALVTGGAGNYRAVVSNRGTNIGFIFYAANNDTWQFWIGNGGGWEIVSGPAVILNKWTHLAGVYSGGTMNFYVDGVLYQHAGTITYAHNTTGPFNIGAVDDNGSSPTFFLPGDVDEVRLWNTARTAAQIHANVFKDLSATESGLVADYKMDVTGTTLTNSCTNVGGLNGTTHNNPPQYPSSIAYQQNTLSFDGTDDYVQVSTNPAGSGNFSIEAWAKVTGGSGYRGVISSSNASFQGFIIYAHDNTWEFWVGTGSGWIQLSGPNIVLNKWTHVAGTYDGTNSRLYVDGILYSTSSSFTYSANPNILRIGASDNAGNASFFFNGDIDEVKIWNTAKPIGEMNNTLHSYFDPTSATNLVAYYSVNQGLNAGSNTFLKTLYDFVGGHNGTMNNFTLTGSTSNFISSGVPLISNAAPAGVAGANLWLKANTGVTNSGSNLTGWTDQSGLNTFTVHGTVGYTANSVNFNPAVAISSTNTTSQLPDNRLDGNTEIQIVEAFAVYKDDVAGEPTTILGNIFTSNPGWPKGIFMGLPNDGDSYVTGQVATNYYTPESVGVRFVMDNVDISPTTSPYLSAWSNGAAKVVTPRESISFPGILDYTNVTLTPLIGGTNNGVSNYIHMRAKLAEIIAYPNGLSASDRSKVQSYLAVKYGISLAPSVTSYVNSAGTVIWNNTTYWNDVFGIGQDDGSGLNQTSSNSVNTGSGDGTGQSGKGNIVLSSPSAMATGDFLLIGHDNGGLTEQTTDLPSGISGSKRLAREWKVAHTNDVGTVNMTFNTTGLTVTGTTAADFRLLIDRDGNGNFTDGTVDAVSPASYAGNILTFSALTLTDGDVFTVLTSYPSVIYPTVTVGPGGVTTNLGLWLKANDGVTVDGSNNVTAWTDHSGVNTFTINGSPNLVPSALNNEDVVELDGIGDYLTGNALMPFQTSFIVVKRVEQDPNDPDASDGGIFGSPTSPNAFMAATNQLHAGNNDGVNRFQGGGLGLNWRLQYAEIIDGQPWAGQRAGNEGYEGAPSGGVGSGTYSPYSAIPYIGRVDFFSNANSSPYFKGQIAELIMYGTSLTEPERRKIYSYLSLKYGIELYFHNNTSLDRYLASDGTIIWNGESSYKSNIYGIGKDDNSGLNKTLSGKGITTLSNPGSLDDGDYLVIGDDNGAPENATDYQSGSLKLGKNWKVKHTNNVGTVTLKLDFNGIAVFDPNDPNFSTFYEQTNINTSNFALLIDDDGDGDYTTGTQTVVAPTSYSNPIMTFDNQTLNDGVVFTFLVNAQFVLPVELATFTANVNNNKLVLNWRTATEVNNYGFEIERSTVGTSRDLSQIEWAKVGFIEGHGNSNSPKEYSFIDETVQNGNYSYRLKQIDLDGKFEYSNAIEIEVNILPTEYVLEQNYPNPFNPSTTIKYAIPAVVDANFASTTTNVVLKVYDVLGNEVATLVNEQQEAGYYEVKFNASNLSTGVYIYRLNAGSFVSVKKMILMK